MTVIDSIQSYFSHIKDLLDLKAFGGKKYLRLPLDEPVFEVDADKREIIVPAEFKKNGISVQGDEIAESLIFKIARFFDYTDFANFMDETNDNVKIQIQWENANKEIGISDAFMVDATESPEYMYIMWPLTEAITRYAGTIKFSLRIYKKEGSAITYSFSTKIAAATINASHDFEVENWTSGFDNALNHFVSSIANSANLATEQPTTPVFLVNLNNAPEGSQVENADYIETNPNDPLAPYIEAYIDTNSPIQTLRVEAGSDDAGYITYKWKYLDTLNAAYADGLAYFIEGEDEYVAVPEEEIVANPQRRYYKQVGEGDDATYELTTFTTEGTLYKKTNKIRVANNMLAKNSVTDTEETKPHVVGKYLAIATNTVGGNTVSAESIPIVFPEPKVLEFTENGNLPPNSYLNNAGEGSIQVAVVVDERGATPSYEWQYSTSLIGPFVPITDLSAEDQEKLSANGNVLTINGLPGFYRAKAISTRNYATIEKDSAVSKVTLPLQPPTITYPTSDVAVSSRSSAATLTVTIEPFNNPLLSENITYQWYTDDGQPVEGATSATYVVPQGTRMGYYCIVTNHMGSDMNSAQTADFSVNPILQENSGETTPEG